MAHKKEKETSLPREQNDIFSAKLGRNYAFGREKSGLFWAEKRGEIAATLCILIAPLLAFSK